MRRSLHALLLPLVLLMAAGALAQAAGLPPGSSDPDLGPAQPARDKAPDLIAKAEDAILGNRYPAALTLLSQALALAPAKSAAAGRAYYDRGYIEEQQGNAAAAQSAYQSAIAADPNQFESHAALGRMLEAQQKWHEAQTQLTAALLLQPASGDRNAILAATDRALAQVDAELHDPVGASDALLTALRLSPEQPDDDILAAQLATQQGNFDGAEAAYRKALQLNPQSQPAVEGLVHLLFQQKKYSEAADVLAPFVQRTPDDATLRTQYADALADEGKTDAAIQQLEALHAQTPDQPAITRMLADLYSTGSKPEQAAPLYDSLLAADAHNAALLASAAENDIRLQRWSQAAQRFQQSVQLSPAQPEAWGGLAFATWQLGQYQTALQALAQREKYSPDDAATLFLKATALDHLNHIDQAITAYQQFLTLADGHFPEEESQTRQRLRELNAAP
jgi:tetratricopeptide (TPR) repeat protein